MSKKEKKPSGTYRVSGYPRYFPIETPDGEGEAIKDGIDEPWLIAVPTGDSRFYGSAESAKRHVRSILRGIYPGLVLSFGEVQRYHPAVEEKRDG